MKKYTKKRGILASAGAFIAAAALALGGAGVANAAPPQPMPEEGTVIITKLHQPDELGDPADGTQQSVTGIINDVTFEAYLVPGTGIGQANDIGTNAGQQAIADWTAASAWTAIGAAASPDSPVPADTQITAGSGVATFADLGRGLYLFREVVTAQTPPGIIMAPDFLVAVPLTDPVGDPEADPVVEPGTRWLTDIFVYPKNASITATKSVVNATDFVVGDTVTWTIDTAIPRVANPDYDASAADPVDQFLPTDSFVITDVLMDSELLAAHTGVTVTAPTGLTKCGENASGDDLLECDYTVTLGEHTVTETNDATLVTIAFTEKGRAALAGAINAEEPDNALTVTLDTKVLKSGIIKNKATVFPDAESQTDNPDTLPVETNEVEVRYGVLNIQKWSTEAELNEATEGTPLAGAQFRVYASLNDATGESGGDVDNYLKPSTNASGLWTTDAEGKLVIDGLRDTDFANGVTQTSTDAHYRTYWLVEVKALEGHQLLAEPIELTVNQDTGVVCDSEDDGYEACLEDWADYEVTNQTTTGGFVLPLTGGSGTLALTVAGLLLLGAVLYMARRRRSQA